MMNQSNPSCTNDCFFKQDQANLSRRSIDWRDSGIVIDEDNHLFESICNFDSKSSIGSITEIHPNEHHQLASSTVNLERGQSALFQDEDGDTILHLAVVGLSMDRVKELITRCDLNAINNMMQTPLHVAVLANRPEMVQLLVDSNARLDVYDRRGNTPLHLACQKGHAKLVEIILDAIPTEIAAQGSFSRNKALNSSNFEGFTCLHLAAMNNNNEITEMLANQYRANLGVKDSKSGETILHKAIRHLNVDLVSFILQQNHHDLISEPDYSGRVPQETIKAIQDSSVKAAQGHNDVQKLAIMRQLIEDTVSECASKGRCCVNRDQKTSKSISSSGLASSSSSDYSDSD